MDGKIINHGFPDGADTNTVGQLRRAMIRFQKRGPEETQP
jgi:hypothetical protein